jgi:hypothetical protein
MQNPFPVDHYSSTLFVVFEELFPYKELFPYL